MTTIISILLYFMSTYFAMGTAAAVFNSCRKQAIVGVFLIITTFCAAASLQLFAVSQ